MTKTELINTLTALNRKNGSFFGFETMTTPKLTAKNRTTKKPTDFVVTIHATFSAMLGVNYANAVNNALEREGMERTFVAQKPFGKHYVEGSKFLMESDKESGKFYLALDMVGGMKKTYLINGREATEEEVEDLKANYLPVPSKPTMGVTWRTYGLDGIIAIH